MQNGSQDGSPSKGTSISESTSRCQVKTNAYKAIKKDIRIHDCVSPTFRRCSFCWSIAQIVQFISVGSFLVSIIMHSPQMQKSVSLHQFVDLLVLLGMLLW